MISMGVTLFPAWQRFNSLVATPDSTSIYIGVGIAGFFILLLIISSRRGAGSSGGTKKSSRRPISGGSFRRKSRAMGLGKPQTAILEGLVKRHFKGNPAYLFTNQAAFDKLLKAGMEDIASQNASPAEKESRKQSLYQIRQIVVRNRRRKMTLRSSKELKPGQKLFLTTQAGTHYSARLLSNMKDGLGIDVPEEAENLKEIVKRGWAVEVHLQLSNGQAFFFTSKVLGHIRLKYTKAVLLKHNFKVTEAQQRQFQRKELDRLCYFYPVHILTSGTLKRKKKAFVGTSKGSLGTMLDVSAGGCSLKTQIPLPKGALIKLDFETSQEKEVKAFGKVVNLSSSTSPGKIMHIQFTKMSQPHLNAINSYIYQL